MDTMVNPVIGGYKNGNYDVVIFNDGTKIRSSDYEDFIPNRLEATDCLITKFCDLRLPILLCGRYRNQRKR